MIIYLKKHTLFKKVIPLLYFSLYLVLYLFYTKKYHLKYLALFVLEDNEIANFLNY